MKEGTITLTQKQVKRSEVLYAFINKSITRDKAAELLSLSPRQISRLKKGYLVSGPGSLIHKNTGRKPAHAVNDEMKETILDIHASSELQGVNFLHFQDILQEDHDIRISYTALYSILKNEGIKSPKKKKKTKRRSRRKPKSHPGELVQIDATPYDWFRTGIDRALHGAIDDATGKLVGLYMTQNECLYGYLETMRYCFLKHGVPQSLYSDQHTIFRSPKAGKLTVAKLVAGETVELTQFGRAMDEVACDIIWARSPQAKGRIERVWDTLQSRIPVDLARAGITSVKEANAFFASGYIDRFNEKFSTQAEGEPLFVPFRKDIDIDTILCIKQKRKTDNAGVFSFKNRTFKILDDGHPVIPAKKEIQVMISPRTGICAQYKDHVFKTVRYIKPLKRPKPKKVKPKVIEDVTTHLRYGSDEWKKIWHYESYEASLQLLYDIFFDTPKVSSNRTDL